MASSESLLALTFDDGPDTSTGPILDLLDEYGAHATFFILGRQVAGREPLLVRMRGAGHELGNHTFEHPRLADLDPAGIAAELARTSVEIERATGVRPRYMRPPYGEGAKRVVPVARRLGLDVVAWTNNPEDWRGEPGELVAARMLDAAVPDDVVVLHDGSAEGFDRRETVRALAIALPAWRDRGFRIVTVGELLQLSPWRARRHAVVEASRVRKAVRLGISTARVKLKSPHA